FGNECHVNEGCALLSRLSSVQFVLRLPRSPTLFPYTTLFRSVMAMSKPIAYIADRAKELGCKVALYNHGGWFGEPENQIEIIEEDRKSTRLNSSHVKISYAVFCLKQKKIATLLTLIVYVG